MAELSKDENRYRDRDDNPRNIWWMVKHEPDWVASRFTHMENEIAARDKRIEELEGKLEQCRDASNPFAQRRTL